MVTQKSPISKTKTSTMVEIFTIGSKVEVSSDEPGFEGAWYVAKLLDVNVHNPKTKNENGFMLKYDSLFEDDDINEKLTEVVDGKFLRPLPPTEYNGGDGFELGDVVDAYYRDGWWIGVIIERVMKNNDDEDDKYVVCFKSPYEQVEFEKFQLRIHADWVDSCWKILPKKMHKKLITTPKKLKLAAKNAAQSSMSNYDYLLGFTTPSKGPGDSDVTTSHSTEKRTRSQKRSETNSEQIGARDGSSAINQDLPLVEYEVISKTQKKPKLAREIAALTLEPIDDAELGFTTPLNGPVTTYKRTRSQKRAEASEADNSWGQKKKRGKQPKLAVNRDISKQGTKKTRKRYVLRDMISDIDDLPLSSWYQGPHPHSVLKRCLGNSPCGHHDESIGPQNQTNVYNGDESNGPQNQPNVNNGDDSDGPQNQINVNNGDEPSTPQNQTNVDNVDESNGPLNQTNVDESNGPLNQTNVDNGDEDNVDESNGPLNQTNGDNGDESNDTLNQTNVNNGDESIGPLNQSNADNGDESNGPQNQTNVDNGDESSGPQNQTNADSGDESSSPQNQTNVDNGDESSGPHNQTIINNGVTGDYQQQWPFIKQSPLWATLESMESYKITPQKPHFTSLKESKVLLREGFAIGLVVTFDDLVRRVKSLQLTDPTDLINDSFEVLVELESHGFDVQLLRDRLTALLAWKVNAGQLQEKLDKMKEDIEKCNLDKSVVEDETSQYEEEISQLEAKIRDLKERVVQNEKTLSVKDAVINKFQQDADRVSNQIMAWKNAFEKLAASPFTATSS